MRIISITNQKGGCGKTTTAINLAAALAINNQKTLLIDLDPQAHASLGLNVSKELTIYDVISNLTNRKSRLEDVTVNIANNFDMVPSNILLSTVEQELADEIARESKLAAIVGSLTKTYDYVLIDCPPNLGLLTVNAIRASNEAIIPVEASRFSIEGLKHLIDILDLIKERLGHAVDYRILITIFDSRLKYSFKILEDMRATFKDKIYSTIIHTNVKLKESVGSGISVLDFDKYSRGAKDYFSLAKEIMAQAQTQHLETQMRQLIKTSHMKMKEFTQSAFSLTAPDAQEVYLVGDFNNWTINDNARFEKRDGMWTKSLVLKPGLYHYRFVIDGIWHEDPNNPHTETNPFGELNSILEVR